MGLPFISKGNHCNQKHFRQLKGPPVSLTGRSVPLTEPSVPLTGSSVPVTGFFQLFNCRVKGLGPSIVRVLGCR